MTNEDEIEFFGFIPATFISELQQEMEEVILNTIKELSRKDSSKQTKISKILNQSFKKNYFIFSNFVLRNILSFPSTFRWERKLSDVLVLGNVKAIVEDLIQSHKKEEEIKKVILKKIKDLEIEKYKKKSYLSLLQSSNKVIDTISDIKKLKENLEDTKNIYNRLSLINSQSNDNYNTLLEYKEIKHEMSRKERDYLLEIADEEKINNIKNIILFSGNK